MKFGYFWVAVGFWRFWVTIIWKRWSTQVLGAAQSEIKINRGIGEVESPNSEFESLKTKVTMVSLITFLFFLHLRSIVGYSDKVTNRLMAFLRINFRSRPQITPQRSASAKKKTSNQTGARIDSSMDTEILPGTFFRSYQPLFFEAMAYVSKVQNSWLWKIFGLVP